MVERVENDYVGCRSFLLRHSRKAVLCTQLVLLLFLPKQSRDEPLFLLPALVYLPSNESSFRVEAARLPASDLSCSAILLSIPKISSK